MTAQTLGMLVLKDIGVLAEGEVMSAPVGADFLLRLNGLVSSWQAQSETVLAIERTIFPVIANKQTYTIGPGGDYNVPRPVGIRGAGLWLNGLSSALAVTSIARTGYAALVTQTSHPFAVGDEVYIDGAVETGYNGLQTVQTVPTANTYTYTLDSQPAATATGTMTAAAVSGEPTEIPRSVITDDAYQSIQLKNLSNNQFTLVYYNATSYPFGTVFLWPRPNTAANQLVLYLENVFTGFADLPTDYAFPQNPGYAEALQYQMDRRMWPMYRGSTPFPEHLNDLARKSFGVIKRANNKLTDLPNDAALLTHDPRNNYNINTGTGGG